MYTSYSAMHGFVQFWPGQSHPDEREMLKYIGDAFKGGYFQLNYDEKTGKVMLYQVDLNAKLAEMVRTAAAKL